MGELTAREAANWKRRSMAAGCRGEVGAASQAKTGAAVMAMIPLESNPVHKKFNFSPVSDPAILQVPQKYLGMLRRRLLTLTFVNYFRN